MTSPGQDVGTTLSTEQKGLKQSWNGKACYHHHLLADETESSLTKKIVTKHQSVQPRAQLSRQLEIKPVVAKKTAKLSHWARSFSPFMYHFEKTCLKKRTTRPGASCSINPGWHNGPIGGKTCQKCLMRTELQLSTLHRTVTLLLARSWHDWWRNLTAEHFIHNPGSLCPPLSESPTRFHQSNLWRTRSSPSLLLCRPTTYPRDY